MAIPDYQTLMLPLLKLTGDRKEHTLNEAVDLLASEFRLSAEERRSLLPSGQTTYLFNRVGWARTYLKKAGLLEVPRRGTFRITERGLSVLRLNPSRIDAKFLDRFEEFKAFRQAGREKATAQKGAEKPETETPEEALENAYQSIRDGLANELLQQIRNSPPILFEKIVVELLVEMGYGGSRRDAGQAVGGSGDEGIDGIIKEDRLGLDIIYLQAKRWESIVSRPEIQKFAGALQGQRAKKGIFITTSDFTKEARDYTSKIDAKIILIDGKELAQLMIDHNIGVNPLAAYEVKRIDSDYFAED